MSRLDVAVVARGLVRSRSRAVVLIRQGDVAINGRTVTRASEPVADGDSIVVSEQSRDVSRAGRKLRAVCERGLVSFTGATVLDAGASTGGFTQVALEHGASRVVAVDVGHGQLVDEVRNDARVLAVEGFNLRALTRSSYAAIAPGVPRPTVIVADLSFISLRYVLPGFTEVVEPDGRIVALVKPQFEVGRGNVRDGIVVSAELRERALRDVVEFAVELGWAPIAVFPSPIEGTHGNTEFLVVLECATQPEREEWSNRYDTMIEEAL